MRSAPPSSETLTRSELPGQHPVSSRAPGTRPPLPPGATLGRYVVLHVLGEGGMGVVYAAHDFVLDRRVAVKVVRPDLGPAEREARRPRLVAEAQAVGRLSHPNVISVYDVGEFCGELYIAMELVAGQTLQDWLRADRRPLEEILDVFGQAGRGLAAAHRAGLIHRDFKPHNVLVGADGRVRVTDFGLAVSQGTASGDGAGTPAYMAPEQASGKGSARADQYSFGVALQEAITGARPGQDGATAQAPGWLRRVIERALRPVEERFPSMDELLAALERGRQSRERLRRRMGAVGFAGVAALVSALAVYRPPEAARVVERVQELVREVVVRIPSLAPAGVAPDGQAGAAAARAPGAPSRATPAPDGAVAAALAEPGPRVGPEVRAPIAPPPGAPPAGPERHDPSWVAALQKLVRALRDLGLVDDSLEIQRSAVASAGGVIADDELDEGGPLSWVPALGFHPDGRASFAAPVKDSAARVTELEGAVSKSSEPVELAEARFELAQALWDTNSDRERALRLAEQARAALQDDDATASTDLLGKITEWLKTRQGK